MLSDAAMVINIMMVQQSTNEAISHGRAKATLGIDMVRKMKAAAIKECYCPEQICFMMLYVYYELHMILCICRGSRITYT